MRFSTPLAAALTLATAILASPVGLGVAAGQPAAHRPGSVLHQATVADAADQPGGGGYAYFPPNRRHRIAVTWDRDLPVTYLIARRAARPSMFATIKEAFRRARVQTGIRFRYGGRAATSKPVGTADRPVVVVDFGTSRSHPRLTPYRGAGVYAVGGPFLTTDGTSGEFTGGQVTIDVRTTRGIGHGFRGSQLGDTLLHEIGHVLGLAHVNAPGQLMAPGSIRANISGWFHDGDLRGLRRLIHG